MLSVIDRLTSDEFNKLISECISRSDVFVKLKMRKSGGSFSILNRRIDRDKTDISHFKRGCQRGENRKHLDENVYTKNSPHRHIRMRVLSDKIMSYECKICRNNGNWMSDELSLELDHINGDRYDNRKENLRWLCPNCHSQTKTFCRKLRT